MKKIEQSSIDEKRKRKTKTFWNKHKNKLKKENDILLPQLSTDEMKIWSYKNCLMIQAC